MWEVDYKESWALKNWCFWTVVLEKTLETPLDCKEIQPVHPKGDQSWVFIGRIDVEAETPILWPPDAKSWLIWKDPDAGEDWGKEEKGTTEDEMVGRHHQLNGHEFGWTPGAGDGQGGLTCYSSWGHKESDTTEWLNWTELNIVTNSIKIKKKKRIVRHTLSLLPKSITDQMKQFGETKPSNILEMVLILMEVSANKTPQNIFWKLVGVIAHKLLLPVALNDGFTKIKRCL